jgi:serine/threonine protein kinase
VHQQTEGMEQEDDSELYQMNDVRVGSTSDDYVDSLHFKITKNLKYQVQILNQSYKGAGAEEVSTFTKQREGPFAFGSTKLSEYQQIDTLGKGTYGEVTKCLHLKTNTVVALKSFLFENVSNGINYSTMREISILK